MQRLHLLLPLVAVSLGLAACTAQADDPPRSRSEIRSRICHEAYKDLQAAVNFSNGWDPDYTSTQAYLYTWTEENCGTK